MTANLDTRLRANTVVRRARVRGGSRQVRTSLPLIGYAAVFFGLTIDVASRISVGPVSLSALICVGIAAALFALAPVVVAQPRLSGIPLPMLLFLLYTTLRALLLPTIDGFQNLSIYAMFVLGIGFAARVSSIERAGKILRVFTTVGVVTSLVYVAGIAIGVETFQARSFALTALVLLAAAVTLPKQGLFGGLAPFLIVAVIVASLSRTASVIALLVLVGLAVRLRHGQRLPLAFAGIFGAVGSLVALLIVYPPFRDRFLGGDGGAAVGGLVLNTSGRSAIWDRLLTDANEAPIFGKGVGSSVEFITTAFHAEVEQPHNDYFRIYHDLGVVGLLLFGLGVTTLIARIIRRAKETDAPVHWAALFAFTAILLAASTDNVIVYAYVMLPLALLIGTSIGLPDETPGRRTLLHPERGRGDGAATVALSSMPRT
ncbi:O-antigen ligase family protein [Curtobacterium sp. Leaf261]|uniref:O-antigen ligase family protein n=1 Tax=Curtobacterium sp. Leaf261 TaxID=1736311 RepID=UPI0006FFB9CC|nr:O-antigen ligase family protein [Curtobacterium sp. Leaf261]KQO61376.1 hypothetical protein ASF23_12930 [Curtobacterium sp. Leaf261]